MSKHPDPRVSSPAVETVTIRKDDYERLKRLASPASPAPGAAPDFCAIAAELTREWDRRTGGIIAGREMEELIQALRDSFAAVRRREDAGKVVRWGESRVEAVAVPSDANDDAGTCELLERVGKGAAGRELDGRTWDEMPGASRAPVAQETTR